MKILIIGGGAREHALCWALMRSRRVGELFCAPGNAGTARLATNVPIGAEAVGDLAEWAAQNAVGLTVVGAAGAGRGIPGRAGAVGAGVRRRPERRADAARPRL